MNSISIAAILAKNTLDDTGAWLILLDVEIGEDTFYFVYNNENITWNTTEYIAFPFDLDPSEEDSKGELPSLKLKVSNVTRALQYYINQSRGCVGARVTLRVVHSNHLNLTVPEVEEVWAITKVASDDIWVTFTLGADYPVTARRPILRFLKNFCPFPYKGIECGATSVLLTCDHSLIHCRARNNATRYGGEPAIPLGGLYATV